MSVAPVPAGGWVPKALVAAFGTESFFCRGCVEADVELQKRLEVDQGDPSYLVIIADDEESFGRGTCVRCNHVVEIGSSTQHEKER